MTPPWLVSRLVVWIKEVKVKKGERAIMNPRFKNREEYEKWRQSKLRKNFASAGRGLEAQLQESETTKNVKQDIEPGKEGTHFFDPREKDHRVISASPKLKICKDCGTQVSKRADKCPHCGAPLRWKSPRSFGCLFVLLLLIFLGYLFSISGKKEDRSADLRESTKHASDELSTGWKKQGTTVKGTGAGGEKERPLGNSTSAASSIPKFQVVAQYGRNLSILVSQNTTAEQLKALIFEFMTARKSNTLSKMIPATTRGDRLGDYAVVSIFVFSEPDWASTDKLKRFIESESDADLQFDKEYVKHIKATYGYTALISSEQGSLGYDDGVVRSPNYLRLYTDEFIRKIEEREKLIKAQFSVWDGSHINLEKLIKKNMNDPGSYKHVETRYWDKGDHLIVRTTFRGKNAFGAVVVNWVKAKVDLNGNIVSVIEQGP
ncbi:MAG: zinc ribbon domain-containing protein [Alphaproteobacteria bacterium]